MQAGKLVNHIYYIGLTMALVGIEPIRIGALTVMTFLFCFYFIYFLYRISGYDFKPLMGENKKLRERNNIVFFFKLILIQDRKFTLI